MRTARFNGHVGGRMSASGSAYVCLWVQGSVCLWVGGVHPSGHTSPGQTPPQADHPWTDTTPSQARHPSAHCMLGWHPSPMHAGILTPWTDWLTDRCKNITFPQLRLRAVKQIKHDWGLFANYRDGTTNGPVSRTKNNEDILLKRSKGIEWWSWWQYS